MCQPCGACRQYRGLAEKESLSLSQRQGLRAEGKNPPREAKMNHNSSGYPLTLSQTNKPRAFSLHHSNTPTCQPPGKGYLPPQCHPESGEEGSAGVTAGGSQGPGSSVQRPLECPSTEKKSLGFQLGGLATDPGQAEVCSAGSYTTTLTLATSSGQDSRTSWHNLCHETPATRTLRQPCVPAQR